MRPAYPWLATWTCALALVATSPAALAQTKPPAGKAPAKAEPVEAPGTILKWRSIKTRWIELPVPAAWKRVRRCVDGEDARRIMWVYESPRRNFKLWLTVKNDKPGVPFKSLSNRYWRHVQHRTNARDFQTLQEQTDATEGKELFMAVGSAEIRRFEKVHAYLVTGLFRRLKRHKKTVSATIAAEGAVLDELMPIASALMDRIKVLDGKAKPPAGKPGAAKPAPFKPGVKPGIKPAAKPALPGKR